MFCNGLKCSFIVHLFSNTKLEHVHCSETSLSGDCVYSKALTHLLTWTDVHFTTVDRTTEDMVARTKNPTPLSNEFITFTYDSWDQVTVAASSESEDSEFVPVGSDIILSANTQNFVHVTGETLIRLSDPVQC